MRRYTFRVIWFCPFRLKLIVKTSFKLENGLLGSPKLVVLILFYNIVSTNKIIKTIPLSI